MRTAGVTGWPIAHSLSPVLHRAWIAAAGIEADYQAFAAETEADFDTLVERVRTGELAGLNVTAPWKARAMQAADTLGPEAEASGSVNLLTLQDGRLRGGSTDGQGLLAALAEQAPGLSLTGATVVMLGAGGAARAAAAALVGTGAELVVVNRTAERAEALVEAVGGRVGTHADLASADLVVNALSAAPEIAAGELRPGAVAMDMTYRPLVTPFLALARGRGLTIVDGLAMLIGQARPSFEAFYAVPTPEGDVRAVALDAMGAAR